MGFRRQYYEYDEFEIGPSDQRGPHRQSSIDQKDDNIGMDMRDLDTARENGFANQSKNKSHRARKVTKNGEYESYYN